VELNLVGEVLDKYGTSLALLGYFVYKDWKFTTQVVQLMQKIDSYFMKQQGGDR